MGPGLKHGRCTANNTRIVTVWDDRYCTDAAHTNSTSKQAVVVRMAQDEGLLDLREVPFDAGATWADIATVHDRAYVDAVRTGTPRPLAESQSFRWSPEQADAVARIWNGHIAACRLALARAWCFTRCRARITRRRARRARASAPSTSWLARRERCSARGAACVAIVDLDVHQGDGTYDWRPATRASRSSTSREAAGWTSVNNDRIEYHVVRDAAAYREALERLPAFLDRVTPDLVQYQAGMDPFEDDPIGGIDGVSEAFLKWRDAFVDRPRPAARHPAGRQPRRRLRHGRVRAAAPEHRAGDGRGDGGHAERRDRLNGA